MELNPKVAIIPKEFTGKGLRWLRNLSLKGSSKGLLFIASLVLNRKRNTYIQEFIMKKLPLKYFKDDKLFT